MDKKNSIDWILIVTIALAFFLLVLSVISPLLCKILINVIDCKASNVAEIVNNSTAPWLAASGIIMSFLAFYIQYRANKEQKEQIAKLNQDKQNELELQYKSVLSLFAMDLNAFCDNAERWIAYLRNYLYQLENNPEKPISEHFVRSKFLERYKTIDRNLLKFAFEHFNINDDSLSLPASFETVYDIVESYFEFIEGETDKVTQSSKLIVSQHEQLVTAYIKLANMSSYQDFLDTNNEYPILQAAINNDIQVPMATLKQCRKMINTNENTILERDYCYKTDFIRQYDLFEKTMNDSIDLFKSYIEFIEGKRNYFHSIMMIINRKTVKGANWPNENKRQ